MTNRIGRDPVNRVVPRVSFVSAWDSVRVAETFLLRRRLGNERCRVAPGLDNFLDTFSEVRARIKAYGLAGVVVDGRRAVAGG